MGEPLSCLRRDSKYVNKSITPRLRTIQASIKVSISGDELLSVYLGSLLKQWWELSIQQVLLWPVHAMTALLADVRVTRPDRL